MRQLAPGDEHDTRYQGRGICSSLLNGLINGADATGIEAIVAKALPAMRTVAVFMGG